MKRKARGISIIFFYIATVFAVSLSAGAAPLTLASSFDEAASIARFSGKPILIQFLREDCRFCERAQRDADTNEVMRQALDNVVLLTLNAKDPSVSPLVEKYHIDIDFPVFVLTNADGAMYTRWTGYISADNFVKVLQTALRTPITIEERIRRFEQQPSLADAARLGRYYREIDEWLTAAEYYRSADSIGVDFRGGYQFDRFKCYADAVLNGAADYESLLRVADEVIDKPNPKPSELTDLGLILCGVARRTDNVDDRLAVYLLPAMEAASNAVTEDEKRKHPILTADYALYVVGDTAKAISIYQKSLGDSWQQDPKQFFTYADWLMKRGIRLDDAERYARAAVPHASEGSLRAHVYVTLSAILEKKGEMEEAVRMMEEAIRQDPDHEGYVERLTRLRGY